MAVTDKTRSMSAVKDERPDRTVLEFRRLNDTVKTLEEPEKPSLVVAPTTFAILQFSVKISFQPPKRNCFSPFRFTIQARRNVFVSGGTNLYEPYTIL